MTTRQDIVNIMNYWLNNPNAHQEIINTYNTIKPLPRGHKMSMGESWCAATYSAAYQKVGAINMIYPECSCGKMIEGAKKMGIWQENDAYVPKPADGIIFDWNDTGKGDDTTGHDHIGCVVGVSGGYIDVIDGNHHNKMGTRRIKINGKTIRGFVTPKFGDTPSNKPTQKTTGHSTIKKGDSGKDVIELQKSLRELRYGPTVSGFFDVVTEQCVEHFQLTHNLEIDGIVGPKTWAALDKAIQEI